MSKNIFIFLVSTLLMAPFAMAKQWQVTPQQDLQQLLDNSADGDVLVLAEGRYLGNFVISHAITLSGAGKSGTRKAIIDGQGQGNIITIKSSGVQINNLSLVNWGDDLTEQNAGIYSDKKTNHLIIKDNYLHGDAFGMWLQKSEHLILVNNTVEGNPKLRSVDRGNGIQLSSIKHAQVRANTIFNTRDGLYIISSQENLIEQNTMSQLRYGIHYMYSHSNKIINNLTFKTRAGYALMSSRNLLVEGNTSKDSEDYGFLMNFITSSEIKNNVVEHVWTKPENKVLGRDGKGLFVYNSAYNTISGNRIDSAEIGIHLTAGSENTKVYGNSFINNPTQVKYVSNKKQEWSFQGKGNFWSNYLGWDMDGDEVGDIIFEPNDGIDKLVWQYPEMKILMDSPAVLILRWVQRQFPVLKPPGVKDSFPLMSAPSFSQQNSPSLTEQQVAARHQEITAHE